MVWMEREKKTPMRMEGIRRQCHNFVLFRLLLFAYNHNAPTFTCYMKGKFGYFIFAVEFQSVLLEVCENRADLTRSAGRMILQDRGLS